MVEEQERAESKKLVLREYHGTYHWDGSEIDKMPGFRCRADDVWVCSFPRSGTTLTMQIVYLIMTLDFDKAVNMNIDIRFPLAELKDLSYPYFRGLDHLDQLPVDKTRLIKSHLHYGLLPNDLKSGKGRIVYITRNPKSSVPSLFRFMSYLKNPPANSLREYLEAFMTGKNVYACPWGLHVREYWLHRKDENMLFLQFENHVKDRKGTIRSIADFLGRDLTDEQIDKIYEYTTLESMKNNNSVNMMYFETLFNTDHTSGGFINTGEASGWRRDIPEDLVKRMDEYIKQEIGETDIDFE